MRPMSDENTYLLNCLIGDLKVAYYNRTGTSDDTVTWATTAYVRLAEMMTAAGFFIGSNTLRAIFTHKYVISGSVNKIHTLERIVKFLGYKSWVSYAAEKGKHPNLKQMHGDDIYATITGSLKQLWEAYQALPKIRISLFSDYYIQESGYFKNLCSELVRLSSYEAKLNTKSFHLIDKVEIKWITNKKAGVQTTERIKEDFDWITPPETGLISLKDLVPTKDGRLRRIESKDRLLRIIEPENFMYLMIHTDEKWRIAGVYGLDDRHYEDIKASTIIEGDEPGTFAYVYPLFHKEFQEEFFPDSEEFDLPTRGMNDEEVDNYIKWEKSQKAQDENHEPK